MQESFKFCSVCGAQNNPDAQFCQTCGAQYSGAPPPHRRPEGLRFLSFLIVIIFGCVVSGGIFKACHSNEPAHLASIATDASPAPTVTPDLPPDELLARAKALLSQPYDASAYGGAIDLLNRIPPEAAQYKESLPLKQKAAKTGERMEAIAATAVRKAFAIHAEESLLSKGIDATVAVSGRENRTLRVTYVLMSRPIVYQLTNQHSFLELAQARGFHNVIFSDGYNWSWRYMYNEKTGQWN